MLWQGLWAFPSPVARTGCWGSHDYTFLVVPLPAQCPGLEAFRDMQFPWLLLLRLAEITRQETQARTKKTEQFHFLPLLGCWGFSSFSDRDVAQHNQSGIRTDGNSFTRDYKSPYTCCTGRFMPRLLNRAPLDSASHHLFSPLTLWQHPSNAIGACSTVTHTLLSAKGSIFPCLFPSPPPSALCLFWESLTLLHSLLPGPFEKLHSDVLSIKSY